MIHTKVNPKLNHPHIITIPIFIMFQRVRLEQDSDGSTLVLGPAEPGDEAVRQR